jgi:hypothetical protein
MSKLGYWQILRANPQDCQVVFWLNTNKPGSEFAPIGQRHLDMMRALNDVRVG